ncbi:MAG TPA: hypothetical protein VER11_14210 [Polyangiaceae bacterium]|nr:hypothetical protein [Polyangiaceae bacterium]
MTALKHVLGSFLAAGVILTSTAAFADGHGRDHDGPRDGGRKPTPASAPELAGKGAPAALALIAAGAAIVISRRRRAS